MKYFTLLLISSLLFFGQVMGGELVTNGEFEQSLSIGWTEQRVGGSIVINRATNYDPDPDYEARVYKGTGTGYARLYQIIDILTTNLDFTVNAKLYAYDNYVGAWAGAAVIIAYINKYGATLGQTYICARSPGCPWTNTSTSHIIPAPNTLWNNYTFNINDELANLSGVNPSLVKQIQVSLHSQGYWC